jgi:predicted AlkP superfamily phosphohydrolase/phosphomutase
MVSGFVAIDLKKATYPDRVFTYLNGMGYRIDVNARLAAENPEAFFKDLLETFDKRRQAIEYLYDNEDWQLFIGTVTETDRLHHFFFDSAREGKHYDIFEKYYRELDSFIGTMAKKAAKDDAVFLTCSDHGFTPIKKEVYLNRWLIENGYLKLDSGEGLKGMTSDTKAFCLDPSRIYIHLKDKYKRGTAKQADCEALVDELKEKLLGIAFEGQTVINTAFLKNEIFHGTHADDGPDVYLLPNYGFDLKGSTSKDYIFGNSHFRGMHTYDDAHLFLSLPVDTEDMKIENVAGIVSQYL